MNGMISRELGDNSKLNDIVYDASYKTNYNLCDILIRVDIS